ncbi:MAG: FMN-binding protein [Clostridia bacterium]|nr:FMN-binding protein [Clostridia bacterium]
MNKNVKNIVVLTSVCAVVALLLAVTNYITAPIIAKQQEAAANEALLVVMPGGEDFAAVDLSAYALPATVTEAYSEKNGGYVFKLTTAGYSSGMVIMCGVDASGKVTGATCLSSGETLGYEKTYGDTVVGATADSVDALDTVGGATKTTAAYRGAVKDALNAAIILGGGSVDIRSEEEILADNLTAALPAGDGKFTSVFITEELNDISAIYAADNCAGYVYVSGEHFVGVDKDGNVVSEVSEELRTKVSDAAKIMLASTTEDIDLSAYADMPSQVLSAKKTASGNYVFELRAAGFGINGSAYYNPSGEYIYIRVLATAAGKIIACETVSQKETDGVGSACANADFYTQFNGKEESNYKEIDAISGATVTTNGYKTAISKVFTAVKILEGEA